MRARPASWIDAQRVLALFRQRSGSVGRQGPRRCRPDQDRGRVSLVASPNGSACPGRKRQPHEHRRIIDIVLHALTGFGLGERRPAARAVLGHFVVFDQQAPVPKLSQERPARLDMVVVEGAIGLVGVDPEADARGQLIPVFDVLKDALAAAAVELGDAQLFDLFLPVRPRRFSTSTSTGRPWRPSRLCAARNSRAWS